jgi:dUTP pyrophosphatase
MIKFTLKDGAKLPRRGSKCAAGMDVCINELVTLHKGERKLVKTDVYLSDCPLDIYLRVAPRSKLAVKLGIDIMAGVVDSDYRGEIRVLLHNCSNDIVSFRRGDAIAQLIPEVIRPYAVQESMSSTGTARGDSGINDFDLRLQDE